MTVNPNVFAELLSTKAGEVERPRPLPVGTYYARVAGPPTPKTVGKDDHPVLDFPIVLIRPGPDITPEMLLSAKIDQAHIAGRKMSYRFFLTEDSRWRLKDFFIALGLDNPDATLMELAAQSPNQQFLASIIHRQFQDNRTNEMAVMAEIGGAARI